MLREVRMKLRAHQADFVIGANDGCAIGGGRAEHSLRQDSGQARRGAGAANCRRVKPIVMGDRSPRVPRAASASGLKIHRI